MRTLKALPSALGIRVLTALGQAPGGLRLSAIADAVEAPLTSVDAAVRRLVAADLVERAADRRYLRGEAAQVDAVAAGKRDFRVLEEAAEERPAPVHRREIGHARLTVRPLEGRKRTSQSEPARQVEPHLRPGEDPGNGAERRE